MINKYKENSLHIASFVLVILLFFAQLLNQKGFVFPIYNPNETVLIIVAYSLAGILIFQLLKGILVSDKSLILRNISILFIGNIAIYAFLFFVNYNTRNQDFFTSTALNFFIGYFIFSIVAAFIGSSLFYNYRNEINKNGFHRFIVLKYFAQAIITNLLLYFVFTKLINPFFPSTIFYKHFMNYIVVGFITVIFLALFYFLEKKRYSFEKEIEKESTKAETATAQFETLKNQLDPHFLFNSLNVLTGLIEENQDKAVDFTSSLSKIYRYVLEQKDKEVVPLEEEIKFAKTYISLLKLRFENSIHYHINLIDFNNDEYIVPLSLQILLENTIKHNSATEQKPLKIRMYKDDNYFVIENSFQPKDSIKESTGIGLNNIKNRYQLISNKEVKIYQTESKFCVALPILTKRINIMENISQDDRAYEKAISRAKELKKFYASLATYIVFSIFFFTLNAITSFGKWWFYWPILGWGLGIGMHAVKVFAYGRGWEERKAQELLDKDKQHNQWQ